MLWKVYWLSISANYISRQNMPKFKQNKSEQVSTSMNKFVQVWTSLYKSEQVCTSLNKFVQVWTSLYKSEQVCAILNKFVQAWASYNSFMQAIRGMKVKTLKHLNKEKRMIYMYPMICNKDDLWCSNFIKQRIKNVN